MVRLGRWTALVAVAFALAGGAVATGRDLTRPSAGVAAACGGAAWKHGTADLVHLRSATCARAKHVVGFVLSHGLIRHGPSRARAFIVPRGRVLGFRFSYVPDTDVINVRDGAARFAFYLCWFNVDC